MPDSADAVAKKVMIKGQLCDWRSMDSDVATLVRLTEGQLGIYLPESADSTEIAAVERARVHLAKMLTQAARDAANFQSARGDKTSLSPFQALLLPISLDLIRRIHERAMPTPQTARGVHGGVREAPVSLLKELWLKPPLAARSLKIGFLSADLRNHPGKKSGMRISL